MQTQLDELTRKYSDAEKELTVLKNAKVLSKYGIDDEEMQEFYAYKIGKLVDDKTDFATAAEGYFKDHPTKNKGHVEVSVPGSSASNMANDANKAINDAIRKAGGFTV